MSDRDSDSGSQTPSRKDTIEYKDVAPEDSASQIESSMSRASQAARKTARRYGFGVAQQRAAKELQIAAMQQEVELDAEGEKNALDAGDEAFERELRNMDALSQRSAPESRGVKHWAPDGHMRRVQVEETRTSCMCVDQAGVMSPLAAVIDPSSRGDSSGRKKAALGPWLPPTQKRRRSQSPLA